MWKCAYFVSVLLWNSKRSQNGGLKQPKVKTTLETVLKGRHFLYFYNRGNIGFGKRGQTHNYFAGTPRIFSTIYNRRFTELKCCKSWIDSSLFPSSGQIFE